LNAAIRCLPSYLFKDINTHQNHISDRKDAREILEKVKDEAEKKIETRELKDKVLSHLEGRDPEWREN